MKNSLFSIIILFSFATNLSGQISSNEFPPSFFKADESIDAEIPTYFIQQPKLAKINKEDEEDDKKNEKPWRFGLLFQSDINTSNEGDWLLDANTGMMTWKLKIKAEKAISINLNFNQFKLTPNSKLYFYNSDYTDVLGAITASNNKKDSIFSIRPIKGDELTIELYIPKNEKSKLLFNIDGIVYGYRSIHDKALKTFNSSGNCNVNINCDEGKNWQDVKRSIALITASNNTRFCTGTLVNNVREDSIPYLLSAAHCGIRNNSIFIFSYESSNCTPSVDGILTNSISNASPRAVANSQQPDFHLFELSSRPPASYNVFYSGWSAINVSTANTACLHHPVGDVMKISLNSDSILTSGYYDQSGTTHWTVNNWEVGTTESGSSGSGLFDQNLRLIGQLHGGEASCGNNAQDYFGKFAISWDGLAQKSRQLKAWLDPDTTNVLVLDGLDTKAALFNDDIQLLGIYGVSSYACDTLISPAISVRNRGSNSIDSLNINYKLDNMPSVSIKWNGNIERNQVVEIPIGPINIISGTHTLAVDVFFDSPNKVDQDSTNNFDSISFQTNDSPINISLHLKTDDYGEETSWDIKTVSNRKLFNGGPYPSINGGVIYQNDLCLYDTCFNLNLFDSFGDGFNGQFGNGYALILGENGDTLLFEDNFTSDMKTISFCVPGVTSVKEINSSKASFLAYPNPISRNGKLFIKNNFKVNSNYVYQISDLAGKVVFEFSGNEVNLPSYISSGVYIISLLDEKNGSSLINQKIIVN